MADPRAIEAALFKELGEPNYKLARMSHNAEPFHMWSRESIEEAFRQIIAALPQEKAGEWAEKCWQELLEKDDRTSPEEYPDMVLISFDELKAALAAAPQKAMSQVEGLIKLLRCDHDWVNYHDEEYWKGGKGYYRSTCDKCGLHASENLIALAADALTAAKEDAAILEKSRQNGWEQAHVQNERAVKAERECADWKIRCAKATLIIDTAHDLAIAETIEQCAKIADVFADVNIEAAGDTILMDPILKGKRPVTAYDEALSKVLTQEGGFRSSMFHAAQNIAAAIRAITSKPAQPACSTCDDTGTIDETVGGKPLSSSPSLCPDCQPADQKEEGK